jgi:hypothetical protein
MWWAKINANFLPKLTLCSNLGLILARHAIADSTDATYATTTWSNVALWATQNPPWWWREYKALIWGRVLTHFKMRAVWTWSKCDTAEMGNLSTLNLWWAFLKTDWCNSEIHLDLRKSSKQTTQALKSVWETPRTFLPPVFCSPAY